MILFFQKYCTIQLVVEFCRKYKFRHHSTIKNQSSNPQIISLILLSSHLYFVECLFPPSQQVLLPSLTCYYRDPFWCSFLSSKESECTTRSSSTPFNLRVEVILLNTRVLKYFLRSVYWLSFHHHLAFFVWLRYLHKSFQIMEYTPFSPDRVHITFTSHLAERVAKIMCSIIFFAILLFSL